MLKIQYVLKLLGVCLLGSFEMRLYILHSASFPTSQSYVLIAPLLLKVYRGFSSISALLVFPVWKWMYGASQMDIFSVPSFPGACVMSLAALVWCKLQGTIVQAEATQREGFRTQPLVPARLLWAHWHVDSKARMNLQDMKKCSALSFAL